MATGNDNHVIYIGNDLSCFLPLITSSAKQKGYYRNMSIPYYLYLDICIIMIAIFTWLPLRRHLSKQDRLAALLTFFTLCILSAAFQYLCFVRVGAWTVHPENTWLLPVFFLGSPLEEYLFWWGFAFVMIEAYLWPRYLIDKGSVRGK